MGAATAGAFTVMGVDPCDGQQKAKNVILLIVDDLRPELRCYGDKEVLSPNIDRLAAMGVQFNRAYCNIAVSGASRSSLLTGSRPTRNTFLDAETWSEREKPDKQVMNTYFKSLGYTTLASGGKIFHHPEDHQEGWDILRERQPSSVYHEAVNKEPFPGKIRGYAYEVGNVPDNAYPDGVIADQSISDLEMLAAAGKPFFFGLGFFKPHLPFSCPKKYWDLYDYNTITVPDNYVLKEGNKIPEIALPNWGELRGNYAGMPEKKGVLVPVDTARKLIHGYRACVTYTDTQIGRVMDKLKQLGLDKNTAIVLIGDNGWNLGEHGAWCKHSILETSIHVPMIIYDPTSKLHGYKSDEVVEFVDLFPTICDILGVKKLDQFEGRSLYPLLNDPKAKSKGYAVVRWLQGYTLVTDDNYFYTEWWDNKDNVTERLLFDHNTDPDENYNVVDRPQYKKKVAELSPLLKQRRGADFDKYAPSPDMKPSKLGASAE